MEEIWVDIEGYENMYQISNRGSLKSLHRKGVRNDRIIVLTLDKYGYYYVVLIKNKIRTKFMIHRLVAIYFIPNINNYPQINHKNGVKINNTVENLEWCTISQNIKHSYNVLHRKPNLTMIGRFGNNNPNAKKINQYHINGKFIKTWDSMIDITKEYKISRYSIFNCCKGKY